MDVSFSYVVENHTILSSSGTFTVPPGISLLHVLACGGGGGGGGNGDGDGAGGAGATPYAGEGGDGAIPTWFSLPVNPQETITVTIGAGGTGGTGQTTSNGAGGAGGNGGNTVLTGSFGTITCWGGLGGKPGRTAIVRAPKIPRTYSLKYCVGGTSGSAGQPSIFAAGGAASSGGGGGAGMGPGGNGGGSTSGGASALSTSYGAGGGGAGADDDNRNGGAGAPGYFSYRFLKC